MGPASSISCDPQRFCRQVSVAKLVDDGNVLIIGGVHAIDEFQLCIISKRTEHGNVHTHIKNQLGYSHTLGTVHRDLKSASI